MGRNLCRMLLGPLSNPPPRVFLRGVLTSLLAASSSSASPPPTQVKGRIFANLYAPISKSTSSDIQQTDIEGWLTVSHKTSSEISSRLTLAVRDLQRPVDEYQPSQPELELREAYAHYRKKGLGLQAGRVLLPWGKADAINPTDFFSGKNYRLSNSDEEVRRTGPTALLGSWTPDQGVMPMTFTWVAAPQFAKSTLLIPEGVLPAGGVLGSPKTVVPLSPGRLEYGSKVSYMGQGWDFSVSGFSGWNHLPDLDVHPTPLFHRMRAIGADFSASFDSLVIRGESAYKMTEDPLGVSGLISPSYSESILGLERPFGDRFRLQIQAYFRYFQNFPGLQNTEASTGPFTAAIASANSLLQGYQFQSLPGATARFSFTSLEQSWDAEIFILSYFPSIAFSGTFNGESTAPQTFARPKVSYEIATGLKGTLGSDVYFGPAGTAFGEAAIYRSVFVEALYVF